MLKTKVLLWLTVNCNVKVKTNKIVTPKWTYHKERSFASNYLIFFEKFCFSLRTSYKELIFCVNDLNVHVCTF